MKISYRKYPALQIYDKYRCKTFINTSDYLDILPCKVADKGEDTMKTVLGMRKTLKKEISGGEQADYFHDKGIYYLSPTFIAAVEHAIPQMNQMVVDYEAMKDAHEDCVMILPYGQSNGTVLEFSTDNEGHHRMTRSIDGALTEFYIYDVVKGEDGKACFHMSCWLNMDNDEGDMRHTSISHLSMWYIFLLFKKYANVETYLIEAGQKQFMKVDFSPIDCKTPEHKAKNEAGINVIVLDSLWYTTICREEGFMVSGHFRLQPCKDSNGHWTRKIIYISAYEKHGYHRQARIRSEAN
jgi:hypothetical protein